MLTHPELSMRTILAATSLGWALLGTAQAADAPNLYLYQACQSGDPEMCPGGTPDLARFDALFDDPAADTSRYPAGGSGPYVRHILPKCEDGSAGPLCPNGSGPTDPIRCTDGTRPVYYVDLSTTGSTRWVLRSGKGGQTCSSEDTENCYDEYDGSEADFSTANGALRQFKSFGGIMSNAADNLFRDWNQVWLDKCTADDGLGHRTWPGYTVDPATGDQVEVYFHGFRVLLALLEDLRSQGLGSATQIAFYTMSGGSSAAYRSIDQVEQIITAAIAPAAEVVLVAAGSPAPDVEDAWEDTFGTAPADDAYPRARFRMSFLASANGSICGGGLSGCSLGTCLYQDLVDGFNCFPKHDNRGMALQWAFPALRASYPAGAVLPPGGTWEAYASYGLESTALHPLWDPSDRSCLATHQVAYGEADPIACRDPNHLLRYHVSTPVFLSKGLADVGVRVYGRPWAPIDHDGDGLWGTAYKGRTWSREDMVRISRRGVQHVDLQASGALGFEAGQRGAFIDNTVAHESLTREAHLHRTMRDSAGVEAEMQTYLMAWLDGARDQLFCVDAEDRAYLHQEVPRYSYVGAPFGPASCTAVGCAIGTPYELPCPYSDPTLVSYQACLDPYANTADTVNHTCTLP